MDAKKKWDVVADRDPRMGVGPTRPCGGGENRELLAGTPLPLIKAQMNGLALAIDHIENLLPELEKRIYPILSASPTVPTAEQRQPVDVPLAEELARFTDRIVAVTNYLADIVMRVEL